MLASKRSTVKFIFDGELACCHDLLLRKGQESTNVVTKISKREEEMRDKRDADVLRYMLSLFGTIFLLCLVADFAALFHSEDCQLKFPTPTLLASISACSYGVSDSEKRAYFFFSSWATLFSMSDT